MNALMTDSSLAVHSCNVFTCYLILVVRKRSTSDDFDSNAPKRPLRNNFKAPGFSKEICKKTDIFDKQD